VTGEAHNDGHAATIREVTVVGLVVNLLLSIVKFVGGTLGGSQAVIADGVHSLSDMTTDVAILVGVRYWTKPADAGHPHGHRRIETVITLGIGVLLAAVAVGLLRNAVLTVREPRATPPGWIAFFAAAVSLVSKEALYRWTVTRGRRIKSMSVIANAWHHRSDAFSSAPAAIAVAMGALDPRWSFVDSIGAVAVSLFIFQASFRIIHPAFHKLIDSGAPERDQKRIRELALDTDGVLEVHAIRTRYVSGSSLAVDLHVLVDRRMTVWQGHRIAGIVERRLAEHGPDVVDVVVHLEPFEQEEGGPS